MPEVRCKKKPVSYGEDEEKVMKGRSEAKEMV